MTPNQLNPSIGLTVAQENVASECSCVTERLLRFHQPWLHHSTMLHCLLRRRIFGVLWRLRKGGPDPGLLNREPNIIRCPFLPLSLDVLAREASSRCVASRGRMAFYRLHITCFYALTTSTSEFEQRYLLWERLSQHCRAIMTYFILQAYTVRPVLSGRSARRRQVLCHGFHGCAKSSLRQIPF